jgi:hypothetical protein
MSTGYDVFPLVEFISVEENAARLEAMWITPPSEGGAKRDPTLTEVRSALHDLGYVLATETVERNNLSLWVRSPKGGGTIIMLENYVSTLTEDTPYRLSFNYGAPRLVVTIVERLARNCGAFVVMENGGDCIIVEPGTDADAGWTSL